MHQGHSTTTIQLLRCNFSHCASRSCVQLNIPHDRQSCGVRPKKFTVLPQICNIVAQGAQYEKGYLIWVVKLNCFDKLKIKITKFVASIQFNFFKFGKKMKHLKSLQKSVEFTQTEIMKRLNC